MRGNLNWRQLATIFGFLLLSTKLDDDRTSIRFFAATVLGLALTVHLLARARRPVLGRIFQFAAIAIGLAFVRRAMQWGGDIAHFTEYVMGAQFLGLGLLSFLPTRAIQLLSRPLLVASWGVGVYLAFPYYMHVGNAMEFLMFPLAVGIAYTVPLVRWEARTRSPMERFFVALRKNARKLLREIDRPVLAAKAFNPLRNLLLQAALTTLPKHLLGTHKGLDLILAHCQKYPQLAIAWKVAYFAHLGKGDYAAAAQSIVEARRYGFHDAHFDRALGYALFHQNDPAWRQVLAEGWQKAEAAGLPLTRHAYFAIAGDRNDIWQSDDQTFSDLQLRLRLNSWNMPAPVSPGNSVAVTP